MSELMVISMGALWVVVTINILLTLAIVRRLAAQQPRSLKRGQRAPAFTAETVQGQPRTLGDYAGRAVALLFISPQCQPCREGLPRYQALAPAAWRNGVDLVLVSIGSPTDTRALANEFKLNTPVLVAPPESNPFMQDYQVSATPSYVLIDAQGKVQSAGHPSFDAGPWKDLVAAWEEGAPAVGGLAPLERG
jgi:peroxiredoxin